MSPPPPAAKGNTILVSGPGCANALFAVGSNDRLTHPAMKRRRSMLFSPADPMPDMLYRRPSRFHLGDDPDHLPQSLGQRLVAPQHQRERAVESRLERAHHKRLVLPAQRDARQHAAS